jgi:ribulose-5-phosphate 4-epimerase/fuculose-1-phosphate aldolase
MYNEDYIGLNHANYFFRSSLYSIAFVVMDYYAVDAVLQSHYRKFIDGSHILHYHRVLDAYGHLSFRDPIRPDVFIMSQYIAPGTISSPDHLVAYRIEDAEPADLPHAKGYAERRIHSEIYKRHARIQAVVHSHSEEVVPYSISGMPMKACYHMAGFLGASGAPVFDVADHLRECDSQDMLVRSEHVGAALAKFFDNGNNVTLMRGHGFTAVADNIESAVYRAIYTQQNAIIQRSAMAMAMAMQSSMSPSPPGIKFLSFSESVATEKSAKWSIQRPWNLWVREVQTCGLYTNSA